MKTLETQIVMNADKVGNNTFTQVKRENDVAMYHRTNMDGSHRSYEVFMVKTVMEGAPLPNGTKVQETYESYPGKSAFGRTAYDCKTILQAEERFEELVKRSKSLTEARQQSAATGRRVRARKIVTVAKVKAPTNQNTEGVKVRGRRGVDRSQLKFPTGEWTMKQAHTLNPEVCHATIWTYAKQLVKSGDLLVCGSKSGGRGKATLLYRFATDAEKKVEQVPVAPSNDTPF